MDICAQPCIQQMQRKLDDILEKLNEDDDPDEGDSALFDLEEIEYVICSEDCQGAEMDRFTLEVKRGSMTPEKREILDDQVMLAAKGCATDGAVATIPEWWQVRLGAGRPQLVIVFKKAGVNGYWQIAIPWPASAEPPETSPLPPYKKGNIQAQIILADNSKFTINCESEAEAEKMLNAAKAAIQSNMLGNPAREHISERKGVAVGPGDMVPVRADYYPVGEKNLKPQWRKRFGSVSPVP